MITILGSLVGFLASHAGEFFRIWQDKNDKKHALDMLNKQIELEGIKHSNTIETSQIKAQAAETQALYQHASQPAAKWVEALRASVRPILTYSFFILFAAVKIATLVLLIKEGSGFFNGLIYLWDEGTQGLFASIMVFWFGQRSLLKNREKNN